MKMTNMLLAALSDLRFTHSSTNLGDADPVEVDGTGEALLDIVLASKRGQDGLQVGACSAHRAVGVVGAGPGEAVVTVGLLIRRDRHATASQTGRSSC